MEIFLLKKHAISYINKCNNSNIRLFQEDCSETNQSKKFIVTTYDKIYNLIQTGRNNLYESWLEDTPLYFGVDIDLYKNIDKEKEILENVIKSIINTAKAKHTHIYKIKDFFLTKTENQTKKLSLHIMCRGLVFENYKACRQFYDELIKDNKLEGIDNSIYRLTCFRLTFCTKKGKNCILKPYHIKIGREVTGKCKKEKDFWLKTLLTNVNKDDKIIKYIKKKEKENEYIVNSNSKNIQLETLLSKLPIEYCNEYNKWIKVGLACYNDNKNNYSIFDNWNKQSNKYNEKSNKRIWNSFKSNSNEITIGSIIFWLKESNIDIKNIFPSIKFIVDNYPAKPIIISKDYKVREINKDKLEISDIKYGINKRLFCIQSEKGTGKTTCLIKTLFESDYKEPESILFISSRRTFGIKLLSDLEKYGFKLYSNIEEQFISVKRVIIQINSLQRLCNIDYDLIIVDECESLARYITSSHFMKSNNSSIITSDLEYRIQNSKKTIIMDADLSDRCINYYKRITNVEENEIRILKNKQTPYEKYTIKYTDYIQWVATILDKIGSNKKLVIPMASNNKAKDLEILIKTKYSNKKVLLIHKETDDQEKLKRLLNVNKDWIKYDIVIYTPTVCMGVSFDVKKYFDYIFAYGCHESLGSQEFCQMIHRVREPKKKEIYIAIDRYDYYDITEDGINYNLVEEMICSDYYLTKYDIHNNLIPKKFGKDRLLMYPYKEDVLYDLYVRNCIERIEDTNNFTASYFGYIKYKKYKLEFFNDKSENMCKIELKEISDLRKSNELQKLVDNIFNADNLSNTEYKEKIMRKEEFMDDKTLFSIKKYNLKECYDLDCFNKLTKDFIVDYYDRGIMLNYNNLKTILDHDEQKTKEKIKILKDNEKYNLEYLSIYEEFKHKNKFTYHYYPYILLKYLGYDINNIDNNEKKDGEIIMINIKKKIENMSLIDFLEKEKNSILFKYRLHKVNIDYNNIDNIIKFINKIIIKQYGVKIKKNKDKYYLTTNNLWDKIDREQKIIVKKLKKNIKFDENDEENNELINNLDEIIK